MFQCKPGFSDTSILPNDHDYSDTLDYRRGRGVNGENRVVPFFVLDKVVLEISDHKSAITCIRMQFRTNFHEIQMVGTGNLIIFGNNQPNKTMDKVIPPVVDPKNLYFPIIGSMGKCNYSKPINLFQSFPCSAGKIFPSKYLISQNISIYA